MKIFYHNDMDGIVSASWVYLSAGITDDSLTKDMGGTCYPMDYQKAFPIDMIHENEQVYIVDFSISPKEMEELLDKTIDVTWIDHHATALDKYNGLSKLDSVRGVRKSGVAGCMLTYCYLHHMTQRGIGEIAEFQDTMVEEAPMDTKLVADYDVWAFKYGDDTTYFKLWFDSVYPTPEEYLDIVRFNDTDGIEKYLNIGKCIKAYVEAQHRYHREGFSYISEFDGHKCLVCNRKDDSQLFGSFINDFDFVVSYIFDGKSWIHSLFSNKEHIHVGEICKKYGGGGHKGAAGFISNNFMFSKQMCSAKQYLEEK